jgi:type I restriction enzyme M protein
MKGESKKGGRQKNLEGFTSPLESATRKRIDQWLVNLGWNIDEESSGCNVTTERPLMKKQKVKLVGSRPDYVLYKSGTHEIIGAIEAKAKGEDLDNALKESISKYVEPLEIPVMFVSDGAFFRTWHRKDGKPLLIDKEPVNKLLNESAVLRFANEGFSIISESPKVQHTREQLISIFKWTNDQLRKEGLRQGVERFTEFANLLFLKLISEIENFNEKNGVPRKLAKKYCWESFSSLDAVTMMEYINGTVLPHLRHEYNRSGEVFQSRLGFSKPNTLKEIVDELSKLDLINVDSDIKGDAFEYFLKDSITVGNDLGEYFTPRHIVRLMVELIEPQFGETIYDPTCGTGGFLIEAFRCIKRTCKQTPENLDKLKNKTVFGRELTNTARIAKMNMILTGDGHTNIEQTDSLESPVKGLYDVVLANPPYGQETDWGHLYDVESKQADCVFIQHIMKSLNERGRAAMIVPEGFLYRVGADQKVRELLLRDFVLDAVISLPSGVFQPYTASKVNIAVFHRGGGQTKKVWFYEVHNDGFDLGATRRPIEENDLLDLRQKWSNRSIGGNAWEASIQQIENNDWMLIASTYRPKRRDDRPRVDPLQMLNQLLEHYRAISSQLDDLKGAVKQDDSVAKSP